MTNIIDFSSRPKEPKGLTWHEEDQLPNLFRGQVNVKSIRLNLYCSPQQEAGWVVGHDLRTQLAGQEGLTLYGPQLLDAWEADPSLIPEECRGKAVFAWGIYRDGDGLRCVRCMGWFGDNPVFIYYWLDDKWYSVFPATSAG